MEKFKNEAKLLAVLRHDNIVNFRGMTKFEGPDGHVSDALVTEFCALCSLKTALHSEFRNTRGRRLKKLPIWLADPQPESRIRLSIVQDIAAGMQYLHQVL